MDPQIGSVNTYVFQRKVYNQGWSWKDFDPASYGTLFLATIKAFSEWRTIYLHAEGVLDALCAHNPGQQFRLCYRETKITTTPRKYSAAQQVSTPTTIDGLYKLAMISSMTHVGFSVSDLPTLFEVGLNPMHNGPYPKATVLMACAFAKSGLKLPEQWFEVDYSLNEIAQGQRLPVSQWVNLAQKAEITLLGGDNRGPTSYSRIDYRNWKPGMSYEEMQRYACAFASMQDAMRARTIK